MKNFFSLTNLYFLAERFISFINSIFFIILIIGLSLALFFSPPDYLQGDSVRILYVHVPSAWLSLMIFSVIVLVSLLVFAFKMKTLFILSKSIAPLGLMFTLLAISTGAIWGRPTWGTWWAWDARLTSMVVLAIFYLLYIFNYKYNTSSNMMKIGSVIAIVGSLNLPIIKYSVDWWNTLHQPASITLTKSTIAPSMLLPLFVMLLVFLLYSALIFLMKYKIEIIKIKNKNTKKND